MQACVGGSAGPRIAVGVLGELQVSVAGRPVAVTTGRLRTALVTLALSPGRAVTVDRLAAALWDLDQPASVRRSVQTYITRLRGLLGPDSVSSVPAGYVLRIDPDDVDAVRFPRLFDAATAEPDPTARHALLTEALDLWRGTPFTGVELNGTADAESRYLTERYLSAVELRVDLDLAADPASGRASDLASGRASARAEEAVADLEALTARYPLRERMWVRLIIALDRSGRPAEALRSYETIRARIADELGADPGPELQAVYADLLAGVSPGARGGARGGAVRTAVVPRQLPPATEPFVGRRPHLTELASHLGGGSVVLIHGQAGAGKTALAVHLAHQAADRFPDGQLYLNLRGFDPSRPAVEPAESLRACFDALEVDPAQVPVGPQAQIGLFRSLLAGRRMLLVLDNARDDDQVRPLLPGSSGCLVLVTSRNQLAGLVAEGAHPLRLGLFGRAEARQLLANRLGHHRVSTDPGAVDGIITRCGRLPLALAVVAARAVTHPDFPLAALAAELDAAADGLDAFAGADAATDVRAVFSWSYTSLSPGAGALFRQLATLPGTSFGVPAAASVAASPAPAVRRLLGELTRAHLLEEVGSGRYTSHDLLRVYAAELSRDDPAGSAAARRRAFDHLLHSAYRAALLIDPHRPAITLAEPAVGVGPESPATHAAARAWLDTERATIMAAIEQAVADGYDTHAWQLAWALVQFLVITAQRHDAITVQELALTATARLGDRIRQAYFHRGLANTWSNLGEHTRAHDELTRALELLTDADERELASVHSIMSSVLAEQHRYDLAIRHARWARKIYDAVGERRRAANTVDEIGWYLAFQGHFVDALEHCGQALAVLTEVGDELGAASSYEGVAYAQQHLGRLDEAIGNYRKALDLYRKQGNRRELAGGLRRLGDTYAEAGRPADASAAWTQALALFEELGDHAAVELRAKVGSNGALPHHG